MMKHVVDYVMSMAFPFTWTFEFQTRQRSNQRAYRLVDLIQRKRNIFMPPGMEAWVFSSLKPEKITPIWPQYP